MTATQVNPLPPKELTLAERIGAKPPTRAQYLNMILYAEPGGGKTYFFGTAQLDPENFLPALAIDIDGGVHDTLAGKFDKIDISPPIRSREALQNLYKEIAADPYHYKSISLDNITELQKMDMNDVMLEAKAQAQNPDKVDLYVPSQREWGKSGERMRIIIRAFRDLPCHTICLAHVEEREDKMTKVNRLWPSMPGKLRNELAGFFSVVGYMSMYEALGEGGVKQQFRQIQFAKTSKVQAKDRFAALPGLMTENPTLPQIWKRIRESGAEIKDEVDPLQVSGDNTIDALKGAINS